MKENFSFTLIVLFVALFVAAVVGVVIASTICCGWLFILSISVMVVSFGCSLVSAELID